MVTSFFCRLAPDDSLQSFSSEQLDDSSVYEIKGVAMGTALLLFNVTTTTGKVVSSWPAEIQVLSWDLTYSLTHSPSPVGV